MRVGGLSVDLEINQQWMNKTISEVQSKFKKLWNDIEKAVDKDVFVNIRKDADNTTKSISSLNEKLRILHWRLEISQIWSENFKALQKEIKNTEKELQKATKGTSNLREAISSLWKAIWVAFVFTQIVNFWKAIFDLTSKNQQLENSFKTLTGSEEKARLVLQQISDLAEDSPFEKFQLAESTKKLIWFWIAAENAVPIMHVLGNAVAAIWGNEETLDGLVLALWQIQAKGKLSAEELMQMAERWIPVFDILRDQLGLTQEQLWNIWNAWIQASEAIPAILTWMQEKYLWALEAQSNTLQGQMWKVMDEIQTQMSDTGKELEWTFKEIVGSIWKTVKTGLPFVLSTFKTVFGSIWNFIKSVFNSINGAINSFVSYFTWWVSKNISAMNVFLIWLQTLWIAFAGLIEVFKWVFSVWVWVFRDLWENISVFWNNTMIVFKNLWENIWTALWNITPYMKQGLKEAAIMLQNFINNAIDLLNKIPWINIEKATFWDNMDWWNIKAYKSLTAGTQSLPWFSNTKDAFSWALWAMKSVATKWLDDLMKNIENIDAPSSSTKAYDMKKLDWIGQAIIDKKAELKELTEWSEEYKAKQTEILELEWQMKDMLYAETKALKWKADATTKAWKAGAGSSKEDKKAKEELKRKTKELEEATKDLEKAYKELETWIENLEKEKEKFTENSKKYEEEIQDWIDKTNNKLREQQEEYKKAIALLKEQRAEKLDDSEKNFAEKIWKRAAEIEAEIAKENKKLADLQAQNSANTIENTKGLSRNTLVTMWKNSIAGSTWNDLLKVKEIAETLEKLRAEKEEIAELMKREGFEALVAEEAKMLQQQSKTYQLIVEREKEIEKINRDFDKKEQEKLDKLKEEEQRAEKLQNIYKVLGEAQRLSREEFENIKKNDSFKNMSQEEQDLIKKLGEEKVKLTEQNDFIIWLEQEIANKKVELSQQTTEMLQKDLSSLWDSYKKIIAQIQSAITAQRQLNSLTRKSSWLAGFSSWGYTWDGWVNEVAWIVHKWEYVIPQKIIKSIPSLVPALENLRTGNTTNNYNKKSIDVWNIVVQNSLDLELFFEKQKWRL